MGIKGLLKNLESCQKDRHVADYSGGVAAVDALGWLHRGLAASALDLAMGGQSDAHLRFCLRRAELLRRCGVTPILVFDGAALPAKRRVDDERRRRREAMRLEGQRYLDIGDLAGARRCFVQAAHVDGEMIAAARAMLEAAGIACVAAPFEADAQMAYLSATGQVDVCISDDSDLLCWGCRAVLFKMDSSGKGKEIQLDDALRTARSFRHFQVACILMGCDYLPRLPRAGPQTAFRLADKAGADAALLVREARLLGINVPDGYARQFEAAYLVFHEQAVFETTSGKEMPLCVAQTRRASKRANTATISERSAPTKATEGKLDSSPARPLKADLHPVAVAVQGSTSCFVADIGRRNTEEAQQKPKMSFEDFLYGVGCTLQKRKQSPQNRRMHSRPITRSRTASHLESGRGSHSGSCSEGDGRSRSRSRGVRGAARTDSSLSSYCSSRRSPSACSQSDSRSCSSRSDGSTSRRCRSRSASESCDGAGRYEARAFERSCQRRGRSRMCLRISSPNASAERSPRSSVYVDSFGWADALPLLRQRMRGG